VNVRFEWGEQGARALARSSDVLVIVDVLSFSTAVDVAVSRGAAVLPFASRDLVAAAEYAEQQHAILAGRRGEGFSLSPVSLLDLPPGSRLVLPSPNGSTISVIAAEHGCALFVACLRNAAAVATAVGAVGGDVAVVAAGERWPDQSLRPAIEDLLGAGAILSVLGAIGGSRSPEAELAADAFEHARAGLRRYLLECQSGRELIALGFRRDVELAAELNVSRTAPRFGSGAFRA
jgi:2-phosphosulfolactate phosphatase